MALEGNVHSVCILIVLPGFSFCSSTGIYKLHRGVKVSNNAIYIPSKLDVNFNLSGGIQIDVKKY